MFDPALVVPTGNFVAMFFVVAGVFVLRARASTRALAIFLAVAAALLVSLAPGPGLLGWLAASPRAAFLFGFLPPVAAAGVVLGLRRG